MNELRESQDKIMALESRMINAPETILEDGRPIELEVRHYFAPGMYARELFIPAGTLLTGKIHKTEHLNILAQGRIEIYNMGESKEMIAPFIYVSLPGTKRAGYAHENSVWITIHATEETDIEVIEQQVIAKDFGDMIEHKP